MCRHLRELDNIKDYEIVQLTGVADTGVVDLNADLMCLGGSNLNVLNAEVLASFPGNCCLRSVSICRSRLRAYSRYRVSEALPNTILRVYPSRYAILRLKLAADPQVRQASQ